MQLAVEEEALQAAALIGPPPPALVEQDQEVAGDERSAEVQRIARQAAQNAVARIC